MTVNEIFSSIEGEGLRQGELATFIRFAGCNLRCDYCDTKYAQKFNQGQEMNPNQIISTIEKIGNNNITLTGGEPLLQSEIKTLVEELVKMNYYVNIETNGAVDVKPFLLNNVLVTMDYKTTSSLMKSKMIIENLNLLRCNDVLKFVIGSHEDMNDVRSILKKDIKSYVYLSPVYNKIEPRELVDLLKNLKKEGYNTKKIRVQIQLHKVIWDSEMRGV